MSLIDGASLTSLVIPHPTFDSLEVLARRGVAGHRQYRIPALAVSAKGTLLAAYDGRPNLDDLPNPIDLLLRRSFDNGKTWETQQTVRTGTGLDGYGDPSLLVDKETGRIFMFHAAGTHAGFFEAVEGLDQSDRIQHADVSFSDDDGATWQHHRLTSMLKKPGITGLFAAAGAGIQIHTGQFTGRLVQQFVVLFEGNIMAASAFSDDHGETWELGELIEGANENKVATLSDGTLLMHSRATPFRLTARSHDGGASYGEASPHNELPDPSDNGSVSRFDGLPNVDKALPATDQWLLATHNHDQLLRRNTVLKLSQDNGATWPFGVVLCEGSSEYSTAARLPDGSIGVMFERQGYQEIVFARVDPQVLLASPIEQLTHRGGTVAAGTVDMDVVLRSITPARPSNWQSIGESFVLTQTDGDWDPATWKEVGQGYSEETPQVLSNRESQDLNYGEVIPGYKVGDLLAFSGRVHVAQNSAPQRASVCVQARGESSSTALHGDELVRETIQAGQSLKFTYNYSITEHDIAAGRLDLDFQVRGAAQEVATRTISFDMESGDVSES